MANIYLAGQKGDGRGQGQADDWRFRADVERPGGRPAELLARLLAEPAIDHVIYRRTGPGAGDSAGATYVVAASKGGASARSVITIEGAGRDRVVGYRLEGDDLFGYGPLPARMTAADIAALTADSDYPDALWQIAEFFRSPRAGDLIVCARPGFDLRARFEYQPHNGSHGGLHRDHMRVPAAVNGAWHGDRVRSVDLFPSILQSLGKPIPSAVDGSAVPIAD